MKQHLPFRLSVIIPVFNERPTIETLLRKVEEVELPDGVNVEIIVIDDFSTDGTRELLLDLQKNMEFSLLFHDQNMGKGAALHTGFSVANGEFVLIQDADLEYDPSDYPKLLAPAIEQGADVVYGTRFNTGDQHRVLYYWHMVVNGFITRICNMITNLNHTDIEVCYKLIRLKLLKNLNLKEKRFGFEPEVTIKLSRLRPKPVFYEVGISYRGRTYEEGKKIGWKDGVRAIYCLVRYAFTRTKPVL